MKTLLATTLPLIALIASPAPALAAPAPQQGDMIIRHVSVIDVEHGRANPDQAVVLRGPDIVGALPRPGPGLQDEAVPRARTTLPTRCCPRPWTTAAVAAVRALSGPSLEPSVPWGLATLPAGAFFARELPIPVGLPLAPARPCTSSGEFFAREFPIP